MDEKQRQQPDSPSGGGDFSEGRSGLEGPVPIGQLLPEILDELDRRAQQPGRPGISPDVAAVIIREARAVLRDSQTTPDERVAAENRIRDLGGSLGVPDQGSTD